MITNHVFAQGNDGRCVFTYGRGPDRERCGQTGDRHANSPVEVARLGGGLAQRDNPAAQAWRDAVEESLEDFEQRRPKYEDPLKTHESTKRVLYHLVSTYQGWRGTSLGVPNEFTDNAVTVGERHLRLVEWFPEDEGWLAGPDDKSPAGSAKHNNNNDNVLALIDVELKRLRTPDSLAKSFWDSRKRRAWRNGVQTAREVAAGCLQEIRDAYLVESLARETETKRRYGINNQESKMTDTSGESAAAREVLETSLPLPPPADHVEDDILAAADTRSLLTEVALRMEYGQNSLKGRDLGRLCLEAIANLDNGVLASTRGRPWSVEQMRRFAVYFGGSSTPGTTDG